MQIDIFNQKNNKRTPTEKELEEIDFQIKSDNIDNAYQVMLELDIPHKDVIKRIVRLNFISFIKGHNELENDGIHPFCRFTMFGEVFNFYESVGEESGVLLNIGNDEFGRVMWIEENDTYDQPLRNKMINNFSLFLSKNWIAITNSVNNNSI